MIIYGGFKNAKKSMKKKYIIKDPFSFTDLNLKIYKQFKD